MHSLGQWDDFEIVGYCCLCDLEISAADEWVRVPDQGMAHADCYYPTEDLP